jgi:flagellar biosynthesis protein FlhG
MFSDNIKFWSIGGGKGGIGKSIFSLGIGTCLARMGHKVILIDGDLGSANLNTLLGIRHPHVTLEGFLSEKVARLEDTVIQTQVEGLGLICGAELLGGADPTYAQKIRLLSQMEDLPAQYVLLDLGAGTSFTTLDLFNYSVGKIILCTNQPTSIQNAYGFIKSALYRRLAREFARESDLLAFLYNHNKDMKIINLLPDLLAWLKENDAERFNWLEQTLWQFDAFLVGNMFKRDADRKCLEVLQLICAKFLHIHIQILGQLPFEPEIELAVKEMRGFPLIREKGRIWENLEKIAFRMVTESRLPADEGYPYKPASLPPLGQYAAITPEPLGLPPGLGFATPLLKFFTTRG